MHALLGPVTFPFRCLLLHPYLYRKLGKFDHAVLVSDLGWLTGCDRSTESSTFSKAQPMSSPRHAHLHGHLDRVRLYLR